MESSDIPAALPMLIMPNYTNTALYMDADMGIQPYIPSPDTNTHVVDLDRINDNMTEIHHWTVTSSVLEPCVKEENQESMVVDHRNTEAQSGESFRDMTVQGGVFSDPMLSDFYPGASISPTFPDFWPKEEPVVDISPTMISPDEFKSNDSDKTQWVTIQGEPQHQGQLPGYTAVAQGGSTSLSQHQNTYYQGVTMDTVMDLSIQGLQLGEDGGENQYTSQPNHEQIKSPFKTSVLVEALNSQFSLKTLLQAQRGGSVFICSTCDKGFAGRKLLSVHRRSHTLEKPDRCGVCGKLCVNRGGRSPRQLTNMQSKSARCTFCGAKFNMGSSSDTTTTPLSMGPGAETEDVGLISLHSRLPPKSRGPLNKQNRRTKTLKSPEKHHRMAPENTSDGEKSIQGRHPDRAKLKQGRHGRKQTHSATFSQVSLQPTGCSKQHSCLFCNKLFVKVPRHMESCHPKKAQVAKILKMPKQKKDRRLAWLKLVKQGDFKHNDTVRKDGKGLLLTAYSMGKRKSGAEVKDYLPCEYCLGTYKRRDLWKHQKNCSSRSAGDRSIRSSAQVRGQLLLPSTAQPGKLAGMLLKTLRNDKETCLAKLDLLVMKFADWQCKKSEGKPKMNCVISQRVRECGKLLKAAHSSGNKMTLSMLLKPTNFQLLVKYVKQVSGYKPSMQKTKTPAVIANLDRTLKRCNDIVMIDALKEGNKKRETMAREYLDLHRNEFKLLYSESRPVSYSNKGYVAAGTQDAPIENENDGHPKDKSITYQESTPNSGSSSGMKLQSNNSADGMCADEALSHFGEEPTEEDDKASLLVNICKSPTPDMSSNGSGLSEGPTYAIDTPEVTYNVDQDSVAGHQASFPDNTEEVKSLTQPQGYSQGNNHHEKNGNEMAQPKIPIPDFPSREHTEETSEESGSELHTHSPVTFHDFPEKEDDSFSDMDMHSQYANQEMTPEENNGSQISLQPVSLPHSLSKEVQISTSINTSNQISSCKVQTASGTSLLVSVLSDEHGDSYEKPSNMGNNPEEKQFEATTHDKPVTKSDKVLGTTGAKITIQNLESSKRHCCLFCGKLYSKVPRHMEHCHSREEIVATILGMAKGSNKRQLAWEKIVKQGDRKHNDCVMSQGEGVIITACRGGKRQGEQTPQNYLQCEYCLGTYRRKSLWRHRKTCAKKVKGQNGSSSEGVPIAQSKSLGSSFSDANQFSGGVEKNVPQLQTAIASGVTLVCDEDSSSKSTSPLKAPPSETPPKAFQNSLSAESQMMLEICEESTHPGCSTKDHYDRQGTPSSPGRHQNRQGTPSTPGQDQNRQGTPSTPGQNQNQGDLESPGQGKGDSEREITEQKAENPQMKFSIRGTTVYGCDGVHKGRPYPNISLQRTGSGKLHCCLFCNQLYSKVPRHMQDCHSGEPEVIPILGMPKGCESRKVAWLKLVKQGDFNHNSNVLRNRKGMLLVVSRRGSKDNHSRILEYLSCEYCLGTYRQREIEKHKRTCSCRGRGSETSHVPAQMPDPHATGKSTITQKNVLSRNGCKLNSVKPQSIQEKPTQLRHQSQEARLVLDQHFLSGAVRDESISGLKSLSQQTCPKPSSCTMSTSNNEDPHGLVSTQDRDKSKLHSCLFCGKLYAKVPRHMQNCHPEEPDVAVITLAMPKGSKERKIAWLKLAKQGDFQHNNKVMRDGKGMLLTAYRMGKRKTRDDIRDYLPCEYCLGTYKRKEIWKHQKGCVSRGRGNTTRGTPQARGRLLLPTSQSDCQEFTQFLKTIRDDGVIALVKLDPLVVKFGADQYEQCRGRDVRTQMIHKLRALGRLLKASRDSGYTMSLSTLLEPRNINILMSFVGEIAGYKPSVQKYTVPSLVVHLGSCLKKCNDILLTEAIKEGNLAGEARARNYFELHVNHFAMFPGRNVHQVNDKESEVPTPESGLVRGNGYGKEREGIKKDRHATYRQTKDDASDMDMGRKISSKGKTVAKKRGTKKRRSTGKDSMHGPCPKIDVQCLPDNIKGTALSSKEFS